MKHDATTGFNDIKALPTFTPPSFSEYLPWIAVGILALFAAFKLYKRMRASISKTGMSLSAKEKAIERIHVLLEKLKGGELSVRDYSSEVSIAFRGFLEDYLDFPAREQTNKEIFSELLPALKKANAFESEEPPKQFRQRISKVLKSFEGITFKRTTEAISSATTASQEAQSIIEDLFQEKSL